MFSHKGQKPSDIPDARDVARSKRAADEELIAGFDAEAAQHAASLEPHINRGLEMIRGGRSGEVAKGKLRCDRGTVRWVVSTASSFVMVDLYGYHGGGRLTKCLGQRYEPHGYEVSGKETDPGYHYYRVFIDPGDSKG
jgi:hypothetical protein